MLEQVAPLVGRDQDTTTATGNTIYRSPFYFKITTGPPNLQTIVGTFGTNLFSESTYFGHYSHEHVNLVL